MIPAVRILTATERSTSTGYSETEFKRLERQGAFLSDLMEDVLRRAALAPVMHVLDVGCGVGDVSLLAATLVGHRRGARMLCVDAPPRQDRLPCISRPSSSMRSPRRKNSMP
jgi:cyclopropane fatty-acyl-phospholipid synthase-like methyltransferase